MPGVHRIAALLKRWLLGTHQGAVSDKHLDYYLDELPSVLIEASPRGSRPLILSLITAGCSYTSPGQKLRFFKKLEAQG
jgi:hypothetical protein